METLQLDSATRNLFDTAISFEDSQNIYRKWALDRSYDEMLYDKDVYTAPPRLTAKMVELFPESRDNKLILDIGAGTGIIGEKLLQAGFANLHALEPLLEFVTWAEEKKIYQKMYPACIGGGSVVDALDDTYDAVVTAGSFGPGSIPADSFHEIVRIVKKGGYFINCMRREYLWTADIYKGVLEPLAQQLEEEGKWERIMWEPYTNHYRGNEGLMMVFRILK